MLHKTVLLLAVLTLIGASPLQKRTTPYELVSVIALEEPCVRQGGICLRVEDCDPSNLVTVRAVLCPSQRHLGVECCYRLKCNIEGGENKALKAGMIEESGDVYYNKELRDAA